MANRVQKSLFLRVKLSALLCIPIIGESSLIISRAAFLLVFNSLPPVWGDDAEKWNPCRFLEDRGIKHESLGAYANL